MTDKELIQALRRCGSDDVEACKGCPAEKECHVDVGIPAASTAANRLETLLAENERLKAQLPKWVSVEERLPEMHTEQIHDSDGSVYSFAVSDRVLVKPRNGEIAIAQYEVSDEGRAMWGDDGGTTFEVTHWMPLPSTEGVE